MPTPITRQNAATRNALDILFSTALATGGLGAFAGTINPDIFNRDGWRRQPNVVTDDVITVRSVPGKRRKLPTRGNLDWIDTTPQTGRAKIGSLYAATRNSLADKIDAVDPLPATAPFSKWWLLPGMLAAGAVPWAAGYSLTSNVRKKQEDVANTAELQDAENNYRAALQELQSIKTGSALEQWIANAAVCDYSELAKNPAFDSLWKAAKDGTPRTNYLEKLVEPAVNAGGLASGMYLTGLTAVGGISAAAAYDAAKNFSRNRALQLALKQRQREREIRRPAAVQIVE
jgi:aryl carrier-like protein